MDRKKIYIFLFDGFSDWEIAYVTPELKKSEKTDVRYFSIDGSKVTSVGGLEITPAFSIRDVKSEEVTMLILPGGDAWEKQKISGIDSLLENLNSDNKTISAICSATTFLGQKGYLDSVKHTSNALAYLKGLAPKYKGESNYQEEVSVSDKNIITANGTAPIEFAREIFQKIELHKEKDIEKWYQLFKNGIWKE